MNDIGDDDDVAGNRERDLGTLRARCLVTARAVSSTRVQTKFNYVAPPVQSAGSR